MTTTPISTASAPLIRRAYHGSCHCGLMRYVLQVSLPPSAFTPTTGTTIPPPPPPPTTVRFYKCNCSTCLKMGYFHVRVPDSPHAFFLLLPPTADATAADIAAGDLSAYGLADYTCFRGRVHWYFCRKCGVRCFAAMGAGEIVDVDLDAALAQKDGETEKEEGGEPQKESKSSRVWRLKDAGWVESVTGYLSVNAHTLEPGQPGLDLRALKDKSWIQYLDIKNRGGHDRFDYPHDGGTW